MRGPSWPYKRAYYSGSKSKIEGVLGWEWGGPMRKYGARIIVGIVVLGLMVAAFTVFRPLPLPILSTVSSYFHYPIPDNCPGKKMNGQCYIH